MSILIQNITVANADGMQKNADLYIEGDRIQELAFGIQASAERTINGTGLVAFPGFFDMHCHLRDPGFTHKEDILTGTRAAAAGGYTGVCCMPNTNPVADSAEILKYIIQKAKQKGFADVFPVAAITQKMQGERLTDFESLLEAGAVAFSDDGMPVESDEVILAAMKRAKSCHAMLLLHEEDLKKRGKGVVHDGLNAKKVQLVGIPREIEERMTERDIKFAEQIGIPLHICHVSTAGSVELIRKAKKRNIPVTCETGPHYYSITDSEVLDKNPNTKVNPPLREQTDVEAIREGIADGTIDAIATDHAPHSEKEKALEIEKAPFGMIGFETAFALTVTNLFDTGIIGLTDIARLLSKRPREILGIEGGKIEKNAFADLTICDMNEKFVYNKDMIVSKAKNSPFLGKELKGRICQTIRKGKFTYDRQAD